MAKPKKPSIFEVPYLFVRFILEGIAVLGTAIKVSVRGIKNIPSAEPEVQDAVMKSKYDAFSKEFETPEFKQSWRAYILRGLAIQTILLTITIAHIIAGDLIIAAQMIILTIASILFFGYRPWIWRNKKIITFYTYLKMGLKKDPQALFLWKNLDFDKK